MVNGSRESGARVGERAQLSSSARRLIGPTFLFLVLAAAAANKDNLLAEIGSAALKQAADFLTYGVQIGIWLSAAFLLNRLLDVFVWPWVGAHIFMGRVPRLIRDIAMVLLYVMAFSGVIGFVFKQEVTSIWAASGVLGIVVGLALKNVILDVFIGVAVSADRPYRIGDFIMLQNNVVGRVLDTNWRTTRLLTNENNTVIIPNSRMGEMMLTNFSEPNTNAEFELATSVEIPETMQANLAQQILGKMRQFFRGALGDKAAEAGAPLGLANGLGTRSAREQGMRH